jgi:serine/threonine-protein kinase PknK
VAARTRDIAGYHGAELIGQGGFSSVYKAADTTHGREVAIKVLEGSLGETERRRFDRERQTMGRLGSHPNIIPVYESGYTESGEGYIVMQLATGGSLGARLRSDGTIPWTEAVEIMAAVAQATQVAHDGGVLHRDIKPDNILIDQYGNPKLSDFGIAAVANNATATMSTTATLAHAAPEVLQGQTVGPGVDIYALGSTLCALITGLPPFMKPGDEGVTPMITRVLTEDAPDLRPRGIPDAVAIIIERSLAKTPEQRQASAAQMAAELKAARSGQPLPAPPLSFNANETMIAQSPTGTPYPPQQLTGPGTAGANPLAPPTYTGNPAPPQGYTGNPAPPQGYTGNPAPPQGYTGNQGPQGFATTPNRPTQTYPGSGYPTSPQGFHTPGQASTGVPPAGAPAPFHPSKPSGGSGGKAFLLVVGGVIGLVLIAGIAIAAANSGEGSTSTTTTSTTRATSTTVQPTTAPSTVSSTTTTAAVVGGPTVTISCPAEIVVGTKIYCTITSSADAVSGEWNLPGFLDAPKRIEAVPGDYEIFINPTNSNAVGSTYTITATVRDKAGVERSSSATFTVAGLSVTIEDCPDQIALNSTAFCNIVSVSATSGEWDIPGFGGTKLDVVPGTNSIQITPSVVAAVGQTFTITATVRDATGAQKQATHSFTVTGK